MPVALRLSRRFYDKFGDDIVNELVELLNQVDTSYRSEIREHIDLNFARFDAKLELRLAEFKLELNLERRLAELKAELIKWMFLFWAGTALGQLLLR